MSRLFNSTSPFSYLPCTDQSLNMCLELVTENKIININNEFHKGKAVGHDSIPISMIQQTIRTIPKPLLHVINLSLPLESFRTISRHPALYLYSNLVINPLLAITDQSLFCQHSQNFMKKHIVVN